MQRIDCLRSIQHRLDDCLNIVTLRLREVIGFRIFYVRSFALSQFLNVLAEVTDVANDRVAPLPDVFLCLLLFDVRFLPNPHFEPALRDLTGHDTEVAEYVVKQPTAQALLHRLREFLAFLIPLYDEEGKAYLTIAIGCTGGQHRSVAVANLLAQELRAAGREVNVSHRDVERRR